MAISNQIKRTVCSHYIHKNVRRKNLYLYKRLVRVLVERSENEKRKLLKGKGKRKKEEKKKKK